jgi:hypothetical protein
MTSMLRCQGNGNIVKDVVFCDMTPCGSSKKNRRFRTKYRLHFQGNKTLEGRMPSSGILFRVAIVRTGISEEHTASIVKVTRIGQLGMLAVTSNRRTPRRNISSETSVLTRGTLYNTPEDGILHSYRLENLKSYIALTGWAV